VYSVLLEPNTSDNEKGGLRAALFSFIVSASPDNHIGWLTLAKTGDLNGYYYF